MLFQGPIFCEGETKEEHDAEIERAKMRRDDILKQAKLVLSLLQEGLPDENAKKELQRIESKIRKRSEAIEGVWWTNEDHLRRTREFVKAEKFGLVTVQKITKFPSVVYEENKLKLNIIRELSRAHSYGALDERFLNRFTTLSSGPTQKLKMEIAIIEVER